MAGETREKESGWTVDTLRYHIDRQIQDLKDLMDERETNYSIALAKALHSTEKAVILSEETFTKEIAGQVAQVQKENVLAFKNSDLAIGKAEKATEKRFDSVNEFRQTLTDQSSTFMPRAEVELGNQRILERLQDLSDRYKYLEGRGSGINVAWLYGLGVVSASGTIVSFVIVLTSK